MPTIQASDLTDYATRLLAAGGLANDEAALIAVSLVGANLRGHDSHGVMRIPYYLEQTQKQELHPGAALTIVHESPVAVVADGNWGFGQTQATRLLRLLLEKVKTFGVAVGTLRSAGHVGRLGEYCESAAEQGLVSIAMANTHGHARRVAPSGGKEPRLGTNPLAIGAPTGGDPMILDFGTSATAEGKVRLRKIAGQPCPDGWLLDSEGRPTNDPAALYANPPGTILPMGGDQAYKGFGLALMVEIFAGALSGGVCSRATPINPNGNCLWLLLVDPDRLGGASHFSTEVEQLLTFVRECPTIAGVSNIQLPGDPERRTLAQRQESGIPFDDGNWNQLGDLAHRLGVAVPLAD